jgi:hypothetical protein
MKNLHIEVQIQKLPIPIPWVFREHVQEPAFAGHLALCLMVWTIVPEARHFSAACFMEIEPNYPYLAILVA